jgi:hypothetical protein
MKTFEKYLGEAFRPLSPKKHWPGEYKAPPKDPIKLSGKSIDDKGYVNLGYANEWKKTPDIVEKCEKLKHKVFAIKKGRGLTEYSCDKCKYRYMVDSTD